MPANGWPLERALRELASPIDIWKYPVDVESVDLLMSVFYPKGINERTDPCMFTEQIHLKLMQLCSKRPAVGGIDQTTDEVKSRTSL